MTVQFLTRAQCGLQPENRSRLAYRSDAVVGITVHVTATPEPIPDPVGTWRGIQSAEMGGRLPPGVFYGDLAYNAGVTLDGRVLAGRDAHWLGAHALSHANLANRMTIGVAIVGSGQTVTPAAVEALHLCGGLFQLAFGRPPVWFGHRDWDAPDGSSTGCPDAWYSTVELLRAHH